jgi:hypothetical protein
MNRITTTAAASLIAACPSVRFMLVGEPGIGKSSIKSTLSKLLPSYHVSYTDCGALDLGDVAMPIPNKDTGQTHYYPSARFGFQNGEGLPDSEGNPTHKPVIIILDEFTKAPSAVQNMLHPLLEETPRLGDTFLPTDTIVVLTGNLGTDGLGDVLKAHTRDRITVLQVRKPTADEWLAWAMGNKVHPAILGFVNQFPQVMDSYLDLSAKDNNPYIYNPKHAQNSFVTPRSLVRASKILHGDSNINDATINALTGTIGATATADLQAFITFHNQLPSKKAILDNPTTAKVPDKAGATAVLVFAMVSWVEKDTLDALVTYVQRLPDEMQVIFMKSAISSVVANQGDFKTIINHPVLAKFLVDNNDYFAVG